MEHIARRLVFQVQRDGALVAMQVLEIRAVARAAQRSPRSFFRRVDLDDVRAPIGELPHGGGPARTRVRSRTIKRERAWDARGADTRTFSEKRGRRESGATIPDPAWLVYPTKGGGAPPDFS